MGPTQFAMAIGKNAALRQIFSNRAVLLQRRQGIGKIEWRPQCLMIVERGAPAIAAGMLTIPPKTADSHRSACNISDVSQIPAHFDAQLTCRK